MISTGLRFSIFPKLIKIILNKPALTRSDAARVEEAAQDLGHAAVADAQLPGNVTGPDAGLRHLHDPVPDLVGQRTAVHEHPAQLVHSGVR